MGRKKLILAASLLLVPGSVGAAAPDNFYGVAPAACVQTGQTAAQSIVFNSAGEASFRDGASGEIILTCPVPSSLSHAKTITVRYKDDGLLRAGTRVVFALRRKSYVFNGVTGDRDSSAETISSVDSDLFASPIVSPQGYRDNQKNLTINNSDLTFDHRKFFYYIQINMTKPSNSAQPVTVAYVQLF